MDSEILREILAVIGGALALAVVMAHLLGKMIERVWPSGSSSDTGEVVSEVRKAIAEEHEKLATILKEGHGVLHNTAVELRNVASVNAQQNDLLSKLNDGMIIVLERTKGRDS